ncbi:MAG: ComEC/Rec2 family competence protein [Actinomycetes bacterium]
MSVEPAHRFERVDYVSDLSAIAMAGVAAVGCWWPFPFPVGPSVLCCGVAYIARRPALVVLSIGLVASGLSARAWAGNHPIAPGSVRSSATLASDPTRLSGAVHTDVVIDGHHLEVWARGRAGAVLSNRASGQQVMITGSRVPRAPADDRAARRHIVGTINATEVVASGDGNVLARAANGVRSVLLRGVDSMPPNQRALFGGFVLGDDRGQSAVTVDDFRGSGLTHLLVVSGENVAFLLVVAMPVLRRLGPRTRVVGTLAVVGFFALMTRFEPSVLRATAMAAIAVVAWSFGRTASSVRVLALAVTAVLLLDPLIVGVLGFQLSVAASAAILVFAKPIAEHLPVPRFLAAPLAVVMAAQAGVGPLLASRLGGIPVATVPANLLAEPAAGFIMGWGMTAGLVAGLFGQAAAAIIHLPTRVLLGWIELVAQWCARLPLGELSLIHIAAAVVGVMVGIIGSQRCQPLLRRAGWMLAVVALVMPAFTRPVPASRTDFGESATMWRGRVSGREVVVVVLNSSPSPSDVLAGFRRNRVDHVDVMVVPSLSRTSSDLIRAVREHTAILRLWAPMPKADDSGQPGVVLSDAETPTLGTQLDLDGFRLEVVSIDPRVEVDVGPASSRPSAAGVVSPRVPRSWPPPFQYC